MNSPKFRTGILGTGNISRSHLNAVRNNADLFELGGVYDVDPVKADAFSKEAGLERAACSVDELLENLDIVQICTPPSFHADLAIQAMEAGVCVLSEKPLCGSLEDMERIADAERRTGKWCASVFQMRYGAATLHLQKLMEEGFLGAPLVGICHTLWFRDHAYYDVAWRGTFQSELGGPTAGHGIHAMDHILSLLGDWSEVRAGLGTLDRAIEVEDVSMALIRFANGAMGSIVNSVLSPRQETYLRMDFQKATVELRHLYSYDNEHWSFTPAVGTDEAFAEKLRGIEGGGRVSHALQLRALAEDLRLGRRPKSSGTAAEATIDLLSSIYKSAITGRPVARGSIKKGDPFYHAFHGGEAVPHRLIASRKPSSL